MYYIVSIQQLLVLFIQTFHYLQSIISHSASRYIVLKVKGRIVDVNKDDCRDYPPGPGSVRLRAGERRAGGEAHHLPRPRARRRGAALPAAAARQLRGHRARQPGAPCAGLPRVYSQYSLVLCKAPSVPQPVVQSRRRPLLGPSPG